jgi:hypothetical protein
MYDSELVLHAIIECKEYRNDSRTCLRFECIDGLATWIILVSISSIAEKCEVLPCIVHNFN